MQRSYTTLSKNCAQLCRSNLALLMQYSCIKACKKSYYINRILSCKKPAKCAKNFLQESQILIRRTSSKKIHISCSKQNLTSSCKSDLLMHAHIYIATKFHVRNLSTYNSALHCMLMCIGHLRQSIFRSFLNFVTVKISLA